MNHSFSVSAATTQITVTAGEGKPRTGIVSFVVTNTTGHELKGGIEIEPLDGAQPEWFTPVFVIGDKEIPVNRMFAAGESCTVRVDIAIPAEIGTGSRRFRLDAYSVDEKEEDYTQGQDVLVTIDPNSAKPPPPFPYWIFAVIGGIVAAGGAIALATWMIPAKLAVPGVVNEPYKQAVDTLKRRGFLDCLTPGVFPDDTADWIVENQNPPAGRKAARNSTVALTITAGVDVPDIIDETEAAGIKMLKIAGFTTAKAGGRDGQGALGTIMAQSPIAGDKAKKGTVVSYWIVRGITVPRIIGMAESTAIDSLRAAFLVPAKSGEQDAEGEVGTIVTQTPPEGAAMKKGSTVSYSTVRGYPVPRVTGAAEAAGVASLRTAGFVPVKSGEQDDGEGGVGTIAALKPSAGAMIKKETTVSYTTVRGYPVPNVVGMEDYQGEAALSSAGFTMNRSGAGFVLASPTIIRQSPAPGTILKKGSPVQCTISN